MPTRSWPHHPWLTQYRHGKQLPAERYQRVIEDIFAYCLALLDSQEGGEDRPLSLRLLRACFLPGGEIALAEETDRRLLAFQ